MRTFLFFALGLILGAVVCAAVIAWQAPIVMIATHDSPVSVEATVERITKVAEADGWKVLGIRKLHESVKKHTGKDVRPVHLVDLCEPNHAGRMLEGDVSRAVSVFMPCTISVWQAEDGSTKVTSTNAKLMGALFGGVVKEVMAGPVAESQAKFIDAATIPAP